MSDGPPPLARFLLAGIVPPDVSEYVCGDLAEEYAVRATRSVVEARRWFWRQVIASAPRLLWRRLTRHGIKALAILCALTALAYVAVVAWDILVARRLTFLVARNTSDAPLLLLRAFYVLAQAVAFALAGATIAYATFRHDESFRRNAVLRLSPVAAAVLIPAFATALFSSDGYSFWFLLPWSITSTAALITGAFLTVKFTHRSP